MNGRAEADQAMELFAPPGDPAAKPEGQRDAPLSTEQFLKRRIDIIDFVRNVLVEATYKSGGKIKQENDYYKVPGSDNAYAFTRQGAAKLGDRFGLKQLGEWTDEHVYTPEHVMYRIRVAVGRARPVLGIAAGSCSTAEKRFTAMNTKKLFGAVYRNRGTKDSPDWEEVQPPDYRAADHDVLAMGKKRAYVAAIVDALAAHDVFHAVLHGPTNDQLKRAILLLSHESVTDEKRMKWADWIAKPSCTAEKMEEQLDVLEEGIHATAEAESQ